MAIHGVLAARVSRWPSRAAVPVLVPALALAASLSLAAPPSAGPGTRTSVASAGAAVPARAVGGVSLPEAIDLQGRALRLNGAGVRMRAVFRVYAAGLYTEHPVDSADALLALPGSKRLHAVMLRDIDAGDLGKLLTRGIEDNAPRAEYSGHFNGILRMADIFHRKKRLAPGEHFSLDFVPGTGTVIRVNGEPAGDPFPDPAFYTLLLKIWFGPSPADAGLRDALLGRPADTGQAIVQP